MEHIILALWLYCVMFSCAGLLVVAKTKLAVKPLAQAKAMPAYTYDFKDTEYREAWLNAFGNRVNEWSNGWIEMIFDKALNSEFAIHGKECCDLWKAMINDWKPASPTKPIYYKGLRTPVRNREWLKTRERPSYPSYAGNGYGYAGVGEVKPNKNKHATRFDRITNFEPWIKSHRAKYDNGYREQFDDVFNQKLKVVKIK